MDQAVNPDLFSISDVLTLVAPYILTTELPPTRAWVKKEGCATRLKVTQISAAGFRFYDPQTIE